jgi:hypothetical protein
MDCRPHSRCRHKKQRPVYHKLTPIVERIIDGGPIELALTGREGLGASANAADDPSYSYGQELRHDRA